MKITVKIKSIIEKNPLVISTVIDEKLPNAIAVAFAKVVDDKVVITDNYMNQTVKDLENNNHVCLLSWDKNWEGYKIIGKAKYFKTGKWKKFAEKIKEKQGSIS